MKAMNWLFEVRLRTAVGPDFRILGGDHGTILFKNMKIKSNDYSLNFEFLSEHEVLEVGKMLAQVYNSISKDQYEASWAKKKHLQSLNRNSEASSKFFKTVIRLQASALHKLLLLTSGEGLLSKGNLDLMLTLAQSKKEAEGAFAQAIVINSRIYDFLKGLYILPGVTPSTSPREGMSAMSLDRKVSVEKASRLMAFISTDRDDSTLKDHLKLDLAESLSTQKSLKELSQINAIQRILRSDYKDVAENMTASELVSLSQILINDAHTHQFPKSILQNRSKAMEKDLKPLGPFESDSIVRYLSKDEKMALSSRDFVEHVNELVNGRDMRAKSQPIVYAALAELLAAKGESKTLEVARTLEHLRYSKNRNLKMYEATVAIISEAFSSENDDLPFGWSAQLSEHAWVLSSHRTERPRRDVVIESLTNGILTVT